MTRNNLIPSQTLVSVLLNKWKFTSFRKPLAIWSIANWIAASAQPYLCNCTSSLEILYAWEILRKKHWKLSFDYFLITAISDYTHTDSILRWFAMIMSL